MTSKTGKFVVVEAPDGCGKTTLINRLDKYLTENNIKHIVVKEPNSLEIGSFARQWIKKTSFTSDRFLNTEALFLFSAQRIELIEQTILPALEEGYLVLSDRFALSTAVYQDLNPDHKLESMVKAVLRNLSQFIKVDATLFLSLDPEKARDRITSRSDNDPTDNMGLEFFKLLQVKYNILLSKFGKKNLPRSLLGDIYKIDADQSEEKVAEEAIKILTTINND